MKKPIGIITTIIGLIISCYSMLLIAASIFEEPTTPYNNNEDLKEIGLAIAFLGIILFALGLFLTASKSKKQRAMEMELSNMNYARDTK